MPIAQPTEVPFWATAGTRTDPGAQESTGWSFQEAPPYDVMNWLQGYAGDWCDWLDQRFDDDGSTLTFLSGGTELQVTTSGLGIGTSPSVDLHIASATPRIRIEDTDVSNYGEISAGSAIGGLIIHADKGDTGSGPYLSFSVGASLNIMRLLESGNVGIGLTNPATLFHLEDTSTPTLRINETGTPTSFLELNNSTTGVSTVQHTAATGTSQLDLNAEALITTEDSILRINRGITARTGAGISALQLHDGSGTVHARIAAGTVTSHFGSQGGDVGIGVASVTGGFGLEVSKVSLFTGKATFQGGAALSSVNDLGLEFELDADPSSPAVGEHWARDGRLKSNVVGSTEVCVAYNRPIGSPGTLSLSGTGITTETLATFANGELRAGDVIRARYIIRKLSDSGTITGVSVKFDGVVIGGEFTNDFAYQNNDILSFDVEIYIVSSAAFRGSVRYSTYDASAAAASRTLTEFACDSGPQAFSGSAALEMDFDLSVQTGSDTWAEASRSVFIG